LQPSTIASQFALGAELLSQAFESESTNLSSANPPKEPITIEIIDASDRPKIAEDENLSISPTDATRVSPQAF